MIHTLMLTYNLSRLHYNKLFKEFDTYSNTIGTNFYPRNNRYTLNDKSMGITWNLILVRNFDSEIFTLATKFNPQILLGKNSYVSVTKAEEIEDVTDKFDKLSSKISVNLPSLYQYNLYRVDYCVNVKVNDIGVKSEQMMELICRSDIPPKFEEIKIYDEKNHRRTPGEGSFYLVNKSVHINYYDKERQLREKFPHCPDIEKAKDIIRFEVQCSSKKLASLKKRLDINGIGTMELLSKGASKECIMDYYKKTVGFEAYYTLEKARSIILKSGVVEKDKEKMIKTLELINQKRSVYKARESLSSGYERRNYNECIKSIRKLGVNPVTIPHSYGIATIPNLINKIEEQF